MTDSTPDKIEICNIGFLLFPGLTQLDMNGPYEVFSLFPGAKINLIWKDTNPVEDSYKVQKITPTTTFNCCPELDLICVPGGPWESIEPIMKDKEVCDFLQTQAKKAKYITSVCTGSLILAAARLLECYEATCHWQFRDCLKNMGIKVINKRVVCDGNRITGGGITSGIDFALVIARKLYGDDKAKFIEERLEYSPALMLDIKPDIPYIDGPIYPCPSLADGATKGLGCC
ncbi:MAG: DJ-1/PfpI family protein [Gloeotrichia echinulata GP01]